MDAVQSSKFITKEKSEDLIKKLEGLTSSANAKQLQRQVFIYNRIKAGNDSIYENVDAIHAAIHGNRQISFCYCEWTIRKELVRRKNGAVYAVSPWALTWDDENYYLVAFDTKTEMIRHYRVDKMQEIRDHGGGPSGAGPLGKLRPGRLRPQDLSAAYAGGEDRKLTPGGGQPPKGVIIDPVSGRMS